MKRSCLIGLSLVSSLLAAGQANPVPAEKPQAEEQGRYGYVAPAQDAYQGAWSISEAQRTAELWKSLCEARPADVGAQLNWFRSERNARLGQNNGELSSQDKKELNSIADRINTTAPGSFEQQISTYYLEFPQPSSFKALETANNMDGSRPELILPMLNKAHAQGDKAALDSWCRQLEARGELAPALTSVAQDLLLSVEPRGILFTNGDMDGAPVLMEQRLRDARRDVLLVDQRLLQAVNYRDRIWKEAGATGPVPSPGPAFAVALSNSTGRPVYLALSLDRDWFDAFRGRLCASGIAFKVQGGACDLTQLEERWGRMQKTMAAGPLSRNYLLPCAVLLQRERSEQDETGASRREAELRSMATATGATNELIKAGVLAH